MRRRYYVVVAFEGDAVRWLGVVLESVFFFMVEERITDDASVGRELGA